MTVQIPSEADLMREVAQLLLQNLSPTKVARFWASWQIGQGDYLAWREEAFGQATVDDLYADILAFQAQPPPTE